MIKPTKRENERRKPAHPEEAAAIAGSVRQLEEEEQQLIRAKEALKKKTAELTDALAAMRATLEATTDGILMTAAHGGVKDYNRRFLEMWGIAPGVAECGGMAELHSIASRQLADPERFLARINEIHVSSAPESFDLLELADGRVFEQYSKLQGGSQRPSGRVWSYRDVTERKRAGIDAVRLAAIVDSSDDAIVSKDLKSIVKSWNAGAERIFGYSAEEMIGTSIMKLIPPERQSEEAEILSRITRGEPMPHFDTIRIRKDGSQIHVSVTVSPIKDSEGRVIGASKIARDVTERKHVEETLRASTIAAEKANKAKDDFLAMLSHELRTPLTPALAAASYLSECDALPAEFHEDIRIIRRNVLLESRLIDDLLDLTRITSGKIQLNLEPVDMHRLLEDTLQIVTEDILQKRLEVTRELAAPEFHTLSDAVRIQQVFWNLINNAVKFTPAGGRIAMKTSNDAAGCFVFEITDTGIGIDPGQQERIFKAFEQGEGMISRQFGGLGLGLAISRNLLNLHGGRVSVKSPGRNQGATFTVVLNAISGRGKERDQTPGIRKGEIKTMRILIVDDHADTRRILAKLLSKQGHETFTGACMTEALALLEAREVDVIISDIGLPDGSGYDLIREAKSRRRVKGIALSGFGTEGDVARSMEAGFDCHLTKPVDYEQLQTRLRELAP